MKCCICAVIRNNGPFLNRVFSNMEKIGTIFEDYKIIIFYDKSDDDTLHILKEYKKTSDKLLFFVNTSPLLKYKTHRLALARNYCINTIKNNFIDYKYFIMMDCDNVCSTDIKINLLKYYLNRNDWDSLSFNHPIGYYDSWALSIKPYVLSCHHFNDNCSGQKLINNIINKTKKDKLIPCLSAFNGFAIYKTEKFINCNYDGRFMLDYIPNKLIKENIIYNGQLNLKENKSQHKHDHFNNFNVYEDCEHRHFHITAVLKNGAKIRISPHCLFT